MVKMTNPNKKGSTPHNQQVNGKKNGAPKDAPDNRKPDSAHPTSSRPPR
jgi:hypothetical protein